MGLRKAPRRDLERILGADFSGVRIHIGTAPPRLGAAAFTMGSDIFFAPGTYAPDTPAGMHLLVHELCHVLQQGAGEVQSPPGPGPHVVNDAALEDEAEWTARQVLAGRKRIVRRGKQPGSHPATTVIQMVVAEVYAKFSTQAVWSGPFGDGENVMQTGKVQDAGDHAERRAWKEAWSAVRAFVTKAGGSFPNDRVDVKFKVDAQICPSCQCWLVENVATLLHDVNGRTGRLFAEVSGVEQRIGRETIWALEIAQFTSYKLAKGKL